MHAIPGFILALLAPFLAGCVSSSPSSRTFNFPFVQMIGAVQRLYPSGELSYTNVRPIAKNLNGTPKPPTTMTATLLSGYGDPVWRTQVRHDETPERQQTQIINETKLWHRVTRIILHPVDSNRTKLSVHCTTFDALTLIKHRRDRHAESRILREVHKALSAPNPPDRLS